MLFFTPKKFANLSSKLLPCSPRVSQKSNNAEAELTISSSLNTLPAYGTGVIPSIKSESS